MKNVLHIAKSYSHFEFWSLNSLSWIVKCLFHYVLFCVRADEVFAWRQELICHSQQNPGSAADSTSQIYSNRSHKTTVSQSGGRQSLNYGPRDHMTRLCVAISLSVSHSVLQDWCTGSQTPPRNA